MMSEGKNQHLENQRQRLLDEESYLPSQLNDYQASTWDMPCANCGYNLEGLPREQKNCPECGHAIPKGIDLVNDYFDRIEGRKISAMSFMQRVNDLQNNPKKLWFLIFLLFCTFLLLILLLEWLAPLYLPF